MRALLRGLGFAELRKGTYACRGGDLAHVVLVRKDRHGAINVSVVVWHPLLTEQATNTFPDVFQSPVQGSVSPRGVVSSCSLKSEDIESGLVTDILTRFLGQFASLADLRSCLEGRYLTPNFAARIAALERSDSTTCMVDSLPSARYEVRGGVLSNSQAMAMGREFIRKIAGPLGFELVAMDDVVAVRARGELHDCIRIVFDDLATMGKIVVFPWSTAIWKVEKRLRGTYYPLVSFPVRLDDNRTVLDVRELATAKVGFLDQSLQRSLAEMSGIGSVADLAQRIGSEWSTLRASLLAKLSRADGSDD
jgi:hypothetical protein